MSDWSFQDADLLAIHMRLALNRRGVKWGENLHTDEQWNEMAQEVINGLKNEADTDGHSYDSYDD